MAIAVLPPQNETANSRASLRELADEIQTQVRRINSLAEAIDYAIDISTPNEAHRAALGRALDYVPS